MGNMKFDGADVTFELDGYDALVERVRSKKVNCKINPSDLPRLYAVMDAELEGNEELAAAFAEARCRLLCSIKNLPDRHEVQLN